MIVFISWNGERSRVVAKALNDWLPNVIQSVKPFFSLKIEKGISGLEKIREKLEQSSFGILCLTPENRNSNWIHFEAGALSKLKENARLWTVLYELKPTDIVAPLSQFQHTVVTEREEVFALLESINLHTDGQVDPSRLRDAFEMWWPKFDDALKHVAGVKIRAKKETGEVDSADIRPSKEILEEILQIVRDESQVGNVRDGTNRRAIDPSSILSKAISASEDLSSLRTGRVRSARFYFSSKKTKEKAESVRRRLTEILAELPHDGNIRLLDPSGHALTVTFYEGIPTWELVDYVELLRKEGFEIDAWDYDET